MRVTYLPSKPRQTAYQAEQRHVCPARRLAQRVALTLAATLAGLCACAPASGPPTARGATVATVTIQAPAPTADPSTCGAWGAASGATGQPVAARYGEISNCERAGDSWVIATEGLAGKPSVIGVDACHGAAACLDGQTSRDLAAWVFYPAPYTGGVRLLGVASPGVLIIDDGGHQMRFTVATGVYAS